MTTEDFSYRTAPEPTLDPRAYPPIQADHPHAVAIAEGREKQLAYMQSRRAWLAGLEAEQEAKAAAVAAPGGPEP